MTHPNLTIIPDNTSKPYWSVEMEDGTCFVTTDPAAVEQVIQYFQKLPTNWEEKTKKLDKDIALIDAIRSYLETRYSKLAWYQRILTNRYLVGDAEDK